VVAPLMIYTKEQHAVTRSYGRRVCLVPIFIEDFVHSMDKVLCRKEVCLNKYRSSKKIAQVSVKKESNGRPNND
jgi:hypothetical protein